MHQLFDYIRLSNLDCLSKMRLCQRCNMYKSSARAGFHQGDGECEEQSECGSLLSSAGDGKKYLLAAQKEARALLNEAGASSDPISERCSVTVNHCCVQLSKLTAEQEGREQGERSRGYRAAQLTRPVPRVAWPHRSSKARQDLTQAKTQAGLCTACRQAGRPACTSQMKCGR